MTSFQRLSNRYLALYLLLFLLPFLIPRVVHAASFDPTRIIDDGVFYNSSSMTVGQIQAFLNSKVPSCDSNGLLPNGGTSRAAYTRSRGFGMPLVCLKNYYENSVNHENNLTKVDGQPAPIPAGAQSAAQIISTAASYYSINPQVLLVLLQKEQGLITDDWPWPSQYKTATGYGCPDTAPCDSQYFGFYNQVNWAAKQFRSYATNPNAFNFIPGPGNNVQFNPNAGCGSTSLNIQNQATASLYDYTPYQPNAAALAAGYGTGDSCSAYGNRNFWLYFNDWFGSTQFPQPIGGALIYQASTNKIFLSSGGTHFYISSWSMMTNYGFDVYPIQLVPDSTIQQLTDGGNLTNLIYDSGGVYLVNNRVRHHVSADMCISWGFSCFDNSLVKSLGSTIQTQYLQTGPELTALSDFNGVTYQLSNGQRFPIANGTTLRDLGWGITPGLKTSPANSSQSIGRLLITTPGVLSFSFGSTIYYYDGSEYFAVPNLTSYNDWGIGRLTQLTVPFSSYNITPPAFKILTPWYQDSVGDKYIIDSGRKVQIPASLQNAWQSITFASKPQAPANALPTTTLLSTVSSGGIFQIYNGKSHHVPTWLSYTKLGITNSLTTVLQPDKLLPIPRGNDALGNGVIFNLQGDAQKRYVINNGKTTWVSDPNTYSIFGFDWGNVLTYTSDILSDYPLASTALTSGTIGGYYYVVGNTALYQIPPNLAPDFGVIGSKFQSLSPQLLNKSNTTLLTRFLYNINTGKIYYVSGGAIHYVASYSAFVAFGGAHTPASIINNAAQSLFTEAQPIF